MRSRGLNIVLLTIITIPDVISGNGSRESRKFIKNMVYNDGDLVVYNEVIIDTDSSRTWEDNIDLNKSIPPISDSDVKCMMHVDRYCSQEMASIKSLLIRALKDGCENCTIKQKESVGKIVASMWTHDSGAWKLFLTRFDSMERLERII